MGHDIVDIQRIEKLLNQFGGRFINKILSATEQEQLNYKSNPARFIAKRFVAKEALSKAVGTGFRKPIFMPAISIINDNLGKPNFIFSPAIQEWLDNHNIVRCHLSISDAQNLTSACVVCEHV